MQFHTDHARISGTATIYLMQAIFNAHWEKVLQDPGVTANVIIVGDELVGYVSCFKMDDLDSVGYWIDKKHWGKGIATRALELLLLEVTARPLQAHVASTNVASLRILQTCGFKLVRVQLSPADDRYPECEVAVLVLL
jgi:RimJ/RimL family protein N-acetyltransferase